MAFLHQLRLLLWKNGLSVIRQPLWSLTLIIWPLIIFIIIAVTRHQFPPIVKNTCYVGPRNLPSTGFFPFLQTLMCNTDSHCYNQSRLVDPSASKSEQDSSTRGSFRSSQWGNLMNGDSFKFPLMEDPLKDPVTLVKALMNVVGTSNGGTQYNGSFMNINASLLGDNETFYRMLESANMLKKAICTVTLPMINTTSSSPASYAVVTFCKSNDTVFEVSLNMLNQILMELMLTKPDEMATLAGVAVVVFDQLQNQTSLWESLLALPELFSSGSIDQVLDSAESLLSNVQGAMRTVQQKFPEAGVPLSMVDPAFALGLRVIRHAKNWPGKDVSIPLGNILNNDSLSEMMTPVLQEVKIPLDKAILLTLDKDMVYQYLCNNTNNPLWMTAVCSTGTVHMLLGRISPNKVAQQALLAWSKHVAQQDVAFAKELLHSLMGQLAPGEQGAPHITRTRRSVETEPQNIEEELFLAVGGVVMDLIQIWPEADRFVRGVLRSGFESMTLATLTLETVDEIVADVLKDADQLKQTYLMLVTNQSEASMWLSRVLDSAMDVIMKVLTSESVTCEDVLGRFEWLLKTETMQIKVLRSTICGNGSDLQQALLMGLMPFVEAAEDFNSTLMVPADYNVTLPMILSEWQKMYNNSMQFFTLVHRLAEELGGAYWMDWMPDNSTHDVTETLQQSVFYVMINLGQKIENSDQWADVKNYFHIVNWILNYAPGVTTPHNCSVAMISQGIECHTDSEFNWHHFVTTMTQTLMSPNPHVVVNSLKGAVNLLQHVYKDVVKSAIGHLLKENIKGGDALSSFLTNLIHNLQSFINKISMLTDEDITNPDTIHPLVVNLLESTGLSPLLPMFSSEGQVNVSTVLHVAIKLIKENQHIFTFNETDPTMPQLEQLIMRFLSSEGNLTASLSNIVLTYVGYFNPADVERLKEAIRPFTNQTSAGIVKAILTAMELLKTVIDPNGDPTHVILEYISQLQNFIMSLFRLRREQQSLLSNGELSAAQFTDLHIVSKSFLSLLTLENIQKLTQAGPDAAQDMVIQKFVAFLPTEIQQDAVRFLQDFKALQHLLTKCAAGHDCLGGISEILALLNQIIDMVLSAEDVNIKINVPNALLMDQEHMEIAPLFFSLLLPPHDAVYVKTLKQALNFIKLVIAMPNVTISDVQTALLQSNLTLEELNNLTSLFGAANIADLEAKIMDVINSQKCFELQHNQMVAPQCVMGLVNGVTGVLTQLPALKNQTAILSLVPLIVNNTIHDILKVNFGSNPNEALEYTLNRILANVKMVLFNTTALHPAEQQIQLYHNIIQNCFELQQDQMVTPQCVMGLINGVTGLVSLLPNLQNETAILSLIPQIANETIRDVAKVNFSSNPYEAVIYTLNRTLANFKMTLKLNNQLTPEIEAVIRALGGLITNQKLLNCFSNDPSAADSLHTQKVCLEAVHVYLKTMESSLSEVFQPFFNQILMQMELQLEQADFSLLVMKSVEHLINNTQHPIDGAGVSQIGQTAANLLQHLFKLIKSNLEFQNNLAGMELFNTTALDEAQHQIELQLDNIQNWLKKPSVSLVLSSMLQWGNISNPSTPVKDLNHLLQTMVHFLNGEELAYLIGNITESLSNAVMVAEQPGSLESDDFLGAILKAAQSAMQILTATNGPLPHSVEQNILEMLQYSLKLILQPDTNFNTSRLISLKILERAESVIDELLPDMLTEYLLPGIKVITTYFESSLTANGQDGWNQIILNEMQTVQSLLPPNSTAQTYVSILINITHFILDSGKGNMSIWSMLENAPVENVPMIIEKMSKLFLSGEELAYIIGNITESLSNAVMVAEQPGGLESDDFLGAILKAAQSAMQILTATNGPLPHSVEQNILEMLQYSLKLILQPDTNFNTSRLISLKILERAESVIDELLPEMLTEYLLPGIKVITTYFESSLTANGQDGWNQIILNEMQTVQSLLPPNSTAQTYVSILINITHFILDSGKGNMSIWSMLENAPVENVPMIIEKMSQLFLSGEELAYLSLIGDITESLSNAVMVAEQPGGLESDDFLDAILKAAQTAMQILTATNGPLPHSVEQNILEMLQYSLKLILQPDTNFNTSRLISLKILERAESVIDELLPEMLTEYLLPGIKVITTYFESSLTANGQDGWNQIILNEMQTVQSLLPPNSTAQTYVSILINITHFILDSGKGNMSIWSMFENASVENVPMIIGKMSKLFSMLWPLIMGGPGSQTGPLSIQGFAHLAAVLEEVLTGMADQSTWDKLEEIIESLLSILKETELWESVPSVIPLFEKIVGSLVNNMQAENALILNLQMPVMTLMNEFARSVNSSHVNLTEVSERMQDAIEHTVQAAQQANGSLECSDVLNIWDPVREAAGLNHSTIAFWCNTNLQSVLEAYNEAQIVYSHLNMSHMGVGPMMANATAARIVRTLQSYYQVSINRTVVAEELIMTFSSKLSMLTGQPLSPEAQQRWNMQLLEVQLLNSLSSLKMLTDQLLTVSPYLQPYVEAVEKALHHLVVNFHQIQEESSSEDIFDEAVMIFLHHANITSDFSDLDKDSLTYMMKQAVKVLMELFEDVPMVYQGLEQFLDDTSMVLEKVAELVAGLFSAETLGGYLVVEVPPKIYHIVRLLVSSLTNMGMDMPANMGLFEELADNIVEMVRQLVKASVFSAPVDYHHGMYMQDMTGRNHSTGIRRKREAPLMPMRSPIDDFIDLFNIDYHTMFKAMSIAPTSEEMMETAHMFFANPDLDIVMKGVTRDMPWYLNASREDTIDAATGMLSFFTLHNVFERSSMELLLEAAEMLPDGFPFASELQNVSRAFAQEKQKNLQLMAETFHTAAELLHISLTDPRFMEQLGHLKSQVCNVEKTESVRVLVRTIGFEPDVLCDTLMPALQFLVKSITMNMTTVIDAVFETFIGDPSTYDVNSNWTSVLSEGLSFNISGLSSLNINITSPGVVTIGEILRNTTAFVEDVQRHMDFDPTALAILLETTLPNNNLVILSWLVNMRHCDSISTVDMDQADKTILKIFCSMSPQGWYSFSLLITRHLNVEKLIYRMVLSEEMQSFVEVMLQMAEVLINMLDKIVPAVHQIQSYVSSMEDLDSMANSKIHHKTRVQRSTDVPKSSFVTLSRALCSNGIIALFGISKLPLSSDDSDPSSQDDPKREEMIERFKLPRNASPFCMNMYLDMVNTTGGAIAWAFLKPMLMGKILFTPDTPVTREIMQKSNATLHELANLRKHSREWIESSGYVLKAAEILSHTLPMLQNSLGNSFVKNFIEMQTDINVGTMKETLSNFSNMTVMLEKNKSMLDQITTLSTLMMSLSSCVKFDRYLGYDSVEQLDADAEDLAKNRDLYASVIFKLPKDSSSRKRRAAPFTSSLPPKVSYTIRMHMDNVMRTDRVRDPYFTKDTHISASHTLRYNRGFVYLQETIDRAIIATQTGQTVTEPAVQLQPFPYPCHHRDEYLEAISFVFPLMLMLAWVLFVADFVKKLVHERELRLHEYMKMMGVNPLSHFFAWFLHCATYLVLTISILTLVLKYGSILPHSNGFILFLYLCDYGLSILAFSYLISSFFDKTFIAGLSGSLLYILCFFPFIVVMAVERTLTFTQKSLLSLFSPTCFSYASQYISRYESQGQGIQWSNSYTSPLAGDTASFGWLCWLMLIDAILYFIIGAYIRMVFPGKYGIPAPWYFPFKASFWADLCCCVKSNNKSSRGLLFTNIMQENQPVFFDDKGKGQSTLSSQASEDYSHLPVGVALHGLSKMYGDRVAIQNLNVSFYESHVTSLLGHNGAGKTTTMSLLTGLFAPSSGTIEVYGRDMQTHIDDVRKELGVCMQYDVLFDHMTTKEHLLLYGQIKAPHWSQRELREQVRTILEETGMYAHRHKRVGTLSGGMKRKLSISIAFIGGSRLVVLDEPTTGVDPCSRRAIWDIVIQHKKQRTIIMSTHHLDEAEVLSDRITFLEKGGLKCCGSPFHLKDKLGQGYKLTLTKKMMKLETERIDNAELKAFIQAHVPEARLKEAQGGDLVYSLPPFTSSNASSYRSLLTALDSNLDALQLGGYGVSDTTLEEVFLQLAHEDTELGPEDILPSISETVSDTGSINSFPSDLDGSIPDFSDSIKLTGSTTVSGMMLAWQQFVAILTKRFHHSRRDWKGLIAQILLPVLFMVFAMGLGSIKSDLKHYPELELSPALYKSGQSYSFFSNSNPNSEKLSDAMMSFPGIDNTCLNKPNNPVCSRSESLWKSSGNSSKPFSGCKCTRKEQICETDSYQPPHKNVPSSQTVYNLNCINVEKYLVSTANDFIRNRYGGFAFGMPLPPDLKMDIKAVPKNRTLSKVWFNPEGHHTMPAYLNSINNFILRSNLPADKDPRKYAISVSSHPYFGRADDEDAIVQGMLQILVAMCVLTGYSITTASFAIYVVNEHHSGLKRLQHIAGISEHFYWAVNFFYDMVMYLIPVTMTICVIAAFQIPAFTDRQNLGAVTLLLVLFGFATFPWMYLLSGIFKDGEMAFIIYVCINLFISINTIMSTSILYFLSQISSMKPEIIKVIFNRMCNAFLIFPQFNFGHGMMQLARKNIEVQILSGYGIDTYQNPFSTDALGWLFISSFIQGVVFFSLRLLINKFVTRKVRHLICGRKTVPNVVNPNEDEDVATEHLRVSSGAAGSDILQVNQLTKIYQNLSKKVHAVKRVSVGIPAGECFGLLGVNGAGKTTTFKMLTGDISPSDGTAQIRDRSGRLIDIMECRNQGINIGYCPQVDALDNLLTGEEHLYFYARIRGISKREIDGVVRYLLKRLELNYHRNITTEGYSCGTRRKLSTALALIGQPQILLLDEPSSGMDPRTKRHLWKIISDEVKGKCAVVLTSHSMEECEALCSRLAIMVKGQFRCLGSLQHIKNRFGSGFTVKMYLAEASCDAEAITDFMQRRFPSTYLKDQHSSMVEYHVPVAPGGVADIFDQLESNKNALRIKHFSVSQTTLDEVFINFALEKNDMESIPIDDPDVDSLGSFNTVET
ncbi:uncharacterized protein abca12 [Notolabrus celidotus]|uniref:uncharacterized protein abca12 n=1 Tax=Notolabrus celidotus TaxID=1203425 RepID=UPI0014905969|nr:uncharacterized protein abca12 [Notolabrus celidotus]